MKLQAGRLRHRIKFERPIASQDPVTGSMTTAWELFAENVPAAIEPLSAREFMTAQSLKSEISARIVIRYLAGLTPDMRITDENGTAYDPAAFIPDPNSGREWLTIPVITC